MARSERNPLRKRLAALRRRLRVVVSLRGAGWLLTLLLASAAVAGFLDWAWRLPALVRAVVLVGTLSGAGLIAYRLLLRPLLTRVDDLTLALRIEERYPSLNDALASTVQFLEQAENRDRREEGRPPMVVSSAMRLEAVRRALGKVTGCDFNRIIDTRGLRTAGLSGIAACLAVAVLAWLYPSLTATALARLTDPFGGHAWPRATVLELDKPRERIGRNEAFEVRGRLRGVIPDKAVVIYRVDGGGRVEYECQVNKGADPNTGSLAVQFPAGKMPRSFRFQVKANDAISPWYRVEVAPPPTLALLDGRPTPQVRLFFPRYTELEPQSLADGTANVNAVAGTLVTLRAAANVPLRSAWIEYQPDGGLAPAGVASLGAATLPALLTTTAASLNTVGPQRATLSKDRHSFFVRFIPPTRGMYTLHFEDKTGLGNSRSYVLNITPDPAPTVTLERPSATRESLSVLPGATLPLRAQAEDPVFGLRRVWLEYRLQPDGPPRKVPLFRPGQRGASSGGALFGLALSLSSVPGKPQQLVIDRPLPLNLLRRPDGAPLREGDVVALKVCADDYDDVTPDKQPGCSTEVEIRIISRAALELALNRDQARIQEELTEIRQQQREAIQKVTEVENRVAGTQKLTPEDLAELLKVEQTQTQIRERITPNQESVRARVERILDTLKQNGIERSAIRERLEPVRSRLDRLGREELQQIESKLNAVRNQGEVPEEGRKERRAETLEKDAEAAAEQAKKLEELARQDGEDAARKARLQEDAKQLRQQATRLRELARGLREEMRMPPKDAQAAAQERGKELERLAEERRRMAAELEKDAARDSTGHDRDKLQQARQLKKSAEALRQEARASTDAARATDKAEMKADLTETRRRQEEVEKTLIEMLKDLEPWSSTREVKGESRALLEEQRKLRDDVKAMSDQVGEQPDQLTPEQKARLDSAAAAQQKLGERMQELLEKMKSLAEAREKQGDKPTADELRKAREAALQAEIPSSMKAAREKLGENQLGNASKEQQQALAGLEKLVKNLEDRREAELDRLIKKLGEAESKLEKLTEEQDKLRKKIKEAAQEKDAKKREEELKRLAGKQRELQKEAEKFAKQLSRLRAERAGQSVAQAAKQMEEAVRRLERGEAGEDKQEEALDRLDEAQEDLEAARGANEEELAREQLAKVADVLKRLKERQDRMVSETERIHKEALEAKAWTRGLRQNLSDYALAQEGLGHECKSLADRELTAASVFARLLRKAAESMQRASEELARHFEKVKARPEDTSAPVAAEQMQKLAQHRLQQILDALKIDEGTPIRGANKQKPMEGSSGRRPIGDGIPPLAQLKLLRALQVEVNERTKEFAAKHPDEKKLTEDEKKELEAIRREQREVAEEIEEYTQKPLPNDRE
jgi:hypothetical protein